MENYRVIALIGKSGCGKSAILQNVIDLAPQTFNKIINVTTRPPREEEIEGKDYYFLTKEDFLAKVVNSEMIEYTQFNHWYYGTTKSSLSADKINIGVFNPEAIRQLSQRTDIDLAIIWIHASDKERLLRQLNREDNPPVEEIIRRFTTDKEDFKHLYTEIECIHLDNENFANLETNVRSILTTFN